MVDSTESPTPSDSELLSNTWIHPLDRPEVVDYIDKHLPSYSHPLATAPRPNISDDASPAQQEMAQDMMERKELFAGSPSALLVSTLYEESFAVQPHMTLGGVLSHFYRTYDSKNRSDNKTSRPREFLNRTHMEVPGTFEDFINHLQLELKSNKASIDDVYSVLYELKAFGIPTNLPPETSMGIYSLNIPTHWLAEDVTRVLRSHDRSNLESGWLYVKSFTRFESQFDEPCSDTTLLAQLNLPHGTSRANVFHEAWKQCGSVIDQGGYYKTDREEGFQAGLERLAQLRSSPDFSFLYQTFTAEESVNPPKVD